MGGVIIGFSIGILIISALRSSGSTETQSSGEEFTFSLPTDVISSITDTQLTLSDGTSFDFSSHLGTPMLVNFWASWCNPCVEEIPLLQQVAQTYADQLIVVGINSGETRSTVLSFIEDYGLTYPIGIDAGNEILSDLGINVLPTTYFIDAYGNISEVYYGPLDPTTINTYLIELGIQP